MNKFVIAAVTGCAAVLTPVIAAAAPNREAVEDRQDQSDRAEMAGYEACFGGWRARYAVTLGHDRIPHGRYISDRKGLNPELNAEWNENFCPDSVRND